MAYTKLKLKKEIKSWETKQGKDIKYIWNKKKIKKTDQDKFNEILNTTSVIESKNFERKDE